MTGTGEVVQKGSHAHSNQGGIYISRSSLERYPQYAMESWRAFTVGPNAQQGRPLYPLDNPLLHLFRNDSWKTLDSLRNVYGTDMLKDFTGRPVCQPVMQSTDGRAFETGCNDPLYPSMSVRTAQHSAVSSVQLSSAPTSTRHAFPHRVATAPNGVLSLTHPCVKTFSVFSSVVAVGTSLRSATRTPACNAR